ncbi:hypothetical protein LTR66_006607 [Elasticomyces elasticus]|nr:hypothetical protein LTR28_001879 [Elasticomyces elasticus]KAK4986787.1 hypothetical protein LTR50_005082 [Elasticomyces elasticus]KAK4991179.1 hypothetical protein LTR66_006607 [Elasticomyces elasticus]
MANPAPRDTHSLTLHDYPSMSNPIYHNNPPFCGVTWRSLDLTRVTAYGSSGSRAQCGQCLQVCGPVGCEDLLVVDQCTLAQDHLDISTAAGWKIVGSDTGNWLVDVQWVDQRRCKNVWKGEMFFPWDPPIVPLERREQVERASGENIVAEVSAAAGVHSGSTEAAKSSKRDDALSPTTMGTGIVAPTPPTVSKLDAAHTDTAVGRGSIGLFTTIARYIRARSDPRPSSENANSSIDAAMKWDAKDLPHPVCWTFPIWHCAADRGETEKHHSISEDDRDLRGSGSECRGARIGTLCMVAVLTLSVWMAMG